MAPTVPGLAPWAVFWRPFGAGESVLLIIPGLASQEALPELRPQRTEHALIQAVISCANDIASEELLTRGYDCGKKRSHFRNNRR